MVYVGELGQEFITISPGQSLRNIQHTGHHEIRGRRCVTLDMPGQVGAEEMSLSQIPFPVAIGRYCSPTDSLTMKSRGQM